MQQSMRKQPYKMHPCLRNWSFHFKKTQQLISYYVYKISEIGSNHSAPLPGYRVVSVLVFLLKACRIFFKFSKGLWFIKEKREEQE